jgi:hypothetical protein
VDSQAYGVTFISNLDDQGKEKERMCVGKCSHPCIPLPTLNLPISWGETDRDTVDLRNLHLLFLKHYMSVQCTLKRERDSLNPQ